MRSICEGICQVCSSFERFFGTLNDTSKAFGVRDLTVEIPL